MASVFQPTYTRPIPAAAERCTHQGKPAVRWRGRGGKWVYAVLCDDATRCRVKSAVWYAKYTNEHGEPDTARGYNDKAATEGLALKLSAAAARRRHGVPVDDQPEHRTMAELVDAFERYVAIENTPAHARRQAQRVRKLAEAVKARRPADFTPARVKTAAGAATKSAANRNHYIGAAKQFTRWLCVSEKAEPTDHLAGLSREADESDRKLVRRSLRPAVFERLLVTTAASDVVHYGLTGYERSVLYLVAASTGLRASELASLKPAAFRLDDAHPTVTVAAAYSKNRRKDTLPLPASVVAAVREMVQAADPKGRVWPNRKACGDRNAWWGDSAEMLRYDLAAAEILYIDTQGRTFDFHALRSQFGTDLDRAGVSLARAQRLMRHSTPLLTSRYYTRPDAAELASEVDRLNRPNLVPNLAPSGG